MKTITVKFEVPDEVDEQEFICSMTDEYFYANRENGEYESMLDDMTFQIIEVVNS